MSSRLNGHFGDLNWGDFSSDDDADNGLTKERQEAIEFAASVRGQWLIGMALYVSLDVLSEQEDNVMTDDLTDMRMLMDQLFPMYKNVIEGDSKDE